MTFTRVRDCLFLVTGLSGLIYQQVTHSYNAVLVGAYLTLLGFPGLAGVVTLVRNGSQSSDGSGPSSPSPSPGPPPSPPLSTSASRDGGEP